MVSDDCASEQFAALDREQPVHFASTGMPVAAAPQPVSFGVRMSEEAIVKGHVTKGPVSNPHSFFAAIDEEDSPHVTAALRRAGVQFSVSVNPHPEPGEAPCDVFWFYQQAEHRAIQAVIKEAREKK